MKIAIIGAGSSYTPELATGLIEHESELSLDLVACFDIDSRRLEVVTGFCRRMAAARGARFEFEPTNDIERALEGASFVLTQIRVGGQQARHSDIKLGLDNDLIGQETTGIGGFAKAMRTIPVLVDLCRKIDARCPDAWLVNFTNPSGLVAEALMRHGRERVIGLCNIPINLHHDVAALLGVEPWRVEIDSFGLNHLSWVRGIRVDGREVLPELFDRVLAAGLPANLSDELDYPGEFLRALGMIPSGYLRYYYLRRRMLRKLKAQPRTRAEQVMELEKKLFSHYADESRTEPPAELSSRGGALYSRAALDVVLSLLLDRKDRQVLD
ncbi:MAG: 6-phospho-beta-glucosidase, partial [Deltaproteobacteria bacterium]